MTGHDTKASIFGASGFIGSHLLKHLQGLGWQVQSFGRHDDTWRDQPLGHVFYCAGLTSDFRTKPFETIDAHIVLLRQVLERGDFKSLLYLSSTRVYAGASSTHEDANLRVNPTHPGDLYNLSKLMGESTCLAVARPDIRIARLSNVYGPDVSSDNFLTSIIRDAIQGKVNLSTGSKSEKDYINIDDVVPALVHMALMGRHRLYNLASGVNSSHHDILSCLQTLTNCDVRFENDAPDIIFNPINTGRLKDEYCFNPRLIHKQLYHLVNFYKSNI